MAVTVTRQDGYIKKILIDWTSDAAGVATGSFHLDGQLLSLITDPSATAPTNLYDVTLLDSEGIDVLNGVGIDRASATTQDVAIVRSGTSIHPVVNDTVTFTIANAGNAKSGQAIIHFIGLID